MEQDFSFRPLYVDPMGNAANHTSRVLIVEDDPDICELIVQGFSNEPYDLQTVFTLADAREALSSQPIDLVVLDLNLPDGDGLSLCREFARSDFGPAIIAVSARNTAIDRVLGLEVGADDYLTKPFEPLELIARVRKLLQRRPQRTTRLNHANCAKFGPWRLDMVKRRLLTSEGKLVILASSEYKLLVRFIESPTVVLSRAQLMPERQATAAYDRSIDLQISRLRQKLASIPGGDDLIMTVRNEGYVLACKVEFE